MGYFSSKASKLLLGVCLMGSTSLFAQEYAFEVTNTTKDKITKILVSEDGKKWGFFDIGKGIAAGATMKLVWDTTTNSQSCEQYVKAVWEDESEAEPAKFDFCEKNLAIEF